MLLIHRSVLLIAMLAVPLFAGEPNYAEIFKQVESPDKAAQEAGAVAFVNALESAIKEAKKPFALKLGDAIRSTTAETRAVGVKSVVEALTPLFQKEIKEKALEGLASTDEKRRKEVHESFVVLLDDAMERNVLQPIVDKLGLPDAAVVEAAKKELLAVPSSAAPFLADALADENQELARNAAALLKQMGPAAKTAAANLAFHLDDESKIVRRAIASALEDLGPDGADGAETLVGYLEDEDKSLRKLAASVLKKMGPGAKDVAADLADLLTSDEKGSRTLAQEILIGLGKDAAGAIDALTEIGKDEKADADAKARAAAVLGAIGGAPKP